MLKIFINDLQINAIIGILDFERITPQKITVDFEAEYQYNKKDFVDYAQIRELIITNISNNSYFLIEEALSDLKENIKKSFPLLSNIKLKITKIEIFDDCSVGLESTF